MHCLAESKGRSHEGDFMVRLGIAVDVSQIIRPRTLEIITDRGMRNPYRTVFIFHRISIPSIL